jgi:hypothetical protein
MFPQLSTIQSDRSLMTQSRFHLAKGNPYRQAFPLAGLPGSRMLHLTMLPA